MQNDLFTKSQNILLSNPVIQKDVCDLWSSLASIAGETTKHRNILENTYRNIFIFMLTKNLL